MLLHKFIYSALFTCIGLLLAACASAWHIPWLQVAAIFFIGVLALAFIILALAEGDNYKVFRRSCNDRLSSSVVQELRDNITAAASEKPTSVTEIIEYLDVCINTLQKQGR